MKILLSLSGGMDSVACLFNCLKNFPHEDIFVHHISILNFRKKGIPETYCCNNIIKKLKEDNINFNYSQSFISSESIAINLGMKAAIIAYLARDIKVTYICDGRKRRLDNIRKFELEHNLPLSRISQFDSFVDPLYKLIYPEYIGYFPLENMNKKEIFDTLPEWAKNNYWSCSRPVIKNDLYYPCNNCSSCREHIEDNISHPVLRIRNNIE